MSVYVFIHLLQTNAMHACISCSWRVNAEEVVAVLANFRHKLEFSVKVELLCVTLTFKLLKSGNIYDMLHDDKV